MIGALLASSLLAFAFPCCRPWGMFGLVSLCCFLSIFVAILLSTKEWVRGRKGDESLLGVSLAQQISLRSERQQPGKELHCSPQEATEVTQPRLCLH